MRNFLTISFLLLGLAGRSQSLCLQTFCKAWNTQVGDTAQVEGILTVSAAQGFGSISFIQKTFPGNDTAAIAYTPLTSASYVSGLEATQIANVTNLKTVGTYVFQVVGKGADGSSVLGADSIIVAAATPACPPQRTVTGITITLFGVTITIPVGQGTKIALSDGTTQSY